MTDLNKTAQTRAAAVKAHHTAQTNTRSAREALVTALAAKGIVLTRSNPKTTASVAVSTDTVDFNALVSNLSACVATESAAKAVSDQAIKEDDDARTAVGV
jgi:type II secretory pathway component PulM